MPTMEEIRDAVCRVASRYPVHRAALFGSYARGEQRQGSDVDVLIDGSKGFSLFSQCGIRDELRRLLGTDVDVVTRPSLKPSVLASAQRDEVALYVAP